ncbi:MAG: shikimate dehydrogenase [Aestuariivita sp.]|nr:shikimate dehydrogenase [Aestuariivita sp.]
MIGTTTPLLAVLGTPIDHSASPRIYNYWIRKYNKDGVYVPLNVHPVDLESVLETLPKLGFIGCNVTIPHKEKVMSLANQVTERAAQIGAANFIMFKENGRIVADNTDGVGFLNNLLHVVPDWNAGAGAAVVLGAGGASRAVVATLRDADVPEIIVVNRTRERAEELKTRFGKRIKVVDWRNLTLFWTTATLIVNTTSLGMTGASVMDFSLTRMPSTAVVYDLVYKPLETDLIQYGRKAGCTTVDGLGMLLHQAAPCFEHWFGERVVIDENVRRVAVQ